LRIRLAGEIPDKIPISSSLALSPAVPSSSKEEMLGAISAMPKLLKVPVTMTSILSMLDLSCGNCYRRHSIEECLKATSGQFSGITAKSYVAQANSKNWSKPKVLLT